MWLWSVVAWSAESVGFWHPDDLAPLSERYRSSSEAMQAPFSDRSAQLEQAARALREYRESLDLLGARAPEAERTRLEVLEQAFQRQSAVLQDFANTLVADYDTTFRAAVDRAVAKVGGAEECAATIRTGPALPGVPQKANPDCQGRNLNADLARAVDGDAALKGDLDVLLARPWPTVSLPAEAQAPIGGEMRWISVRALVTARGKSALSAIDRRDDDARTPIDAAIESAASVDELRALEPQVQAIEARTAADRASLAGPVLAAAEAHMGKKWAGEPATGWCANPAALGGCTGEDQTRALVERLLADKKVAKSFPG